MAFIGNAMRSRAFERYFSNFVLKQYTCLAKYWTCKPGEDPNEAKRNLETKYIRSRI